MFYFTAFLILFALFPNLRVDNVSLSLYWDIEQVITRHVYELPPSDSCNILVNFESLYGINDPLDLLSVRAFITFPKADKDLFIILASSRVVPFASVFSTFSDPARSQQYSFPYFEVSVLTFFC